MRRRVQVDDARVPRRRDRHPAAPVMHEEIEPQGCIDRRKEFEPRASGGHERGPELRVLVRDHVPGLGVELQAGEREPGGVLPGAHTEEPHLAAAGLRMLRSRRFDRDATGAPSPAPPP